MKKFAIIFLSLFLVVTIKAQEEVEKLPGDPSLVSSSEDLKSLEGLETGTFKYSVRDYFKKPEQYSFKFSPNGAYFSYKERDENGKGHVYVQDTETDEVTRIIEEGEELIRGYGWANDNRIIYLKDKGGDENYHLFAVDLDGKNDIDLTPYDGVKVNISESLKEQPNHMIIEMNKENPQVFEPYKIDITDGKLEKLYSNDDPANPIGGYTFDKDGNLRGFAKQENGVDYGYSIRLMKKRALKRS